MGEPTPDVVFLPGASGARDFWRPVAQRLPSVWRTTLLNWPGAGEQPHDPRVRSFDDLIALTSAACADGCDLVAQSMGGIVAVGVALAQPHKVRRLVLVATSGGIDLTGLGAVEWRDEYRAAFPDAAAWILEERPDYGAALSGLHIPTSLIWGDSDPISPVAVGERLQHSLPNASLHVLPRGTHELAREQPDEVAALIIEHVQ
jgi:pimeloyl-ACP methyl ester carboxylesterase